MEKNFDQVIFGKKSFSDLLKNIYDNNQKTEKQISDLIISLKPFIKTAADAIMIVPLIKEYLEVKVKNDEHLVKMASVIQRAIASNQNKNANGELLLSDNEKEQLLLEVNAMDEEQIKITTKTQKLINKND